jgi:hypothetical protein
MGHVLISSPLLRHDSDRPLCFPRGARPRHAPGPPRPEACWCRSRGSMVRPHTAEPAEWRREPSHSAACVGQRACHGIPRAAHQGHGGTWIPIPARAYPMPQASLPCHDEQRGRPVGFVTRMLRLTSRRAFTRVVCKSYTALLPESSGAIGSAPLLPPQRPHRWRPQGRDCRP